MRDRRRLTVAVRKNIETLLCGLNGASPSRSAERDLTQGLADTGIMAALYSKFSWPLLEQAAAPRPRVTGGSAGMADSYNGRRPDGSYSTLMTSFPAMTSWTPPNDRATAESRPGRTAETLKISPLSWQRDGSADLLALAGRRQRRVHAGRRPPAPPRSS